MKEDRLLAKCIVQRAVFKAWVLPVDAKRDMGRRGSCADNFAELEVGTAVSNAVEDIGFMSRKNGWRRRRRASLYLDFLDHCE